MEGPGQEHRVRSKQELWGKTWACMWDPRTNPTYLRPCAVEQVLQGTRQLAKRAATSSESNVEERETRKENKTDAL